MIIFPETSLLDSVTDSLRLFLLHQGAMAPLLLLFLEESGIPVPLPGDVIIMYAGYQVSRGTLSYGVAFFLLLLSVLVGSSILYYISQRFGQHVLLRIGKYIHLNEKKLLFVEHKFKKYGPLVIIFGRHIPGFRVPITVFSGISDITYKNFILSTFVSVIFWIPFYLGLGIRLGPNTMRFLNSHPIYLILALIPFLLFLGSAIFYTLVKKPTKEKK